LSRGILHCVQNDILGEFSSNEYARFFTIVQNDRSGVFFFGNPTNIDPETLSHISILTSQFYYYARFFTIVQNDRAGVFFLEIQPILIPKLSLTSQYSHLNSIITQDSSLLFRMIGQGCFFGNPTNINPEILSQISIPKSQFYHYVGSFNAFRMTCRGDFLIAKVHFLFRYISIKNMCFLPGDALAWHL